MLIGGARVVPTATRVAAREKGTDGAWLYTIEETSKDGKALTNYFAVPAVDAEGKWLGVPSLQRNRRGARSGRDPGRAGQGSTVSG